MQIIVTIIILSVKETTHHQNSAESVASSTSSVKQTKDLWRNKEGRGGGGRGGGEQQQDLAYTIKVRLVRAHPLWYPIQPVYDPDQPDGRLTLTVSAFNHLGRIPAVVATRPTAMQNSPLSSLAVS